jgi:phenylacetic acid degradation operon negative regulatory protein
MADRVAPPTELLASQADSAGPRAWILDIYGSFIREREGWIAVAHLLDLAETLGVSAASSRASISRMKRRNELVAETRDGRKGYTLTPLADEWLGARAERIQTRASRAPAASWLLASFSVPEHDRQGRYQIRARLHGLGFGNVTGGLMIAPSALRPEAERALTRAGLESYVTLWTARYLGFDSEEAAIREAWDLPAIEAAYRTYQRLIEHHLTHWPETDQEAFIGYMVNVNAWRELPFLDPGLPRSLLPDDWPASEAEELFYSTGDRLRAAAWRYVKRVVESTRAPTRK